MFFSHSSPRSLKSFLHSSGVTTALATLLFPALLNAQNPPQLIMLDPVPALLSGPKVTSNLNLLASKGRKVQGSSADGASEVVLRIPANAAGEHFTITVINDQGQQSVSAAEDGGLGKIGAPGFASSQLAVRAANTAKGPMAFAIYGAPVDFPRPEGQDASATERFITLDVLDTDTGLSTDTPVALLRPPVGLIHGLWGSPGSWDNFTPFITDPRFAIGRADYSAVIGGQIQSYEPAYPGFAIPSLKNAQANSLGFAYNAPHVLKQLAAFVNHFKAGKNPVNIPVAAVQVDIVAHSMGGDITRTFPQIKGFYGNVTFGLGGVHKMVTIGTPHWGSPLASHLVDDNNECVRGVLAESGAPSFTSVTFNNGMTVNGGVGDLQGDGFGGSLSPALVALQNPIPHPLPTALIQGLESQSQLDGLDTSPVAQVIRAFCFGDYLATHLTSEGWPEIFGQDSDSIVPALSEVAGLSDFTQIDGVIHSASAELLGFGPPAELDAAGNIPATVTNLLNTPVTNAVYVGLPQ
ncbi:MAG: lipase family alpha/beta hydrolase [Terriglobales bacterium]